MLPIRIGLISQSTSITFPELSKVANALSLQVARDLAPIWGVTGTVSAVADEHAIDPGVWPVYIVDQMDSDMAGFHLTAHNQPYAMVQYGRTWSLGASHEVLEMLVDPSGSRLVAANAVGIVDNNICDVPGKFEYLLEVCDPSEDEANAYLIDGVLVSDFYTPQFFAPSGTSGDRYSFSGRIGHPRQVLPNGYLTWFDPASNLLQQVRHFGAPGIITLATGRPGQHSLTNGLSLRTFVDGATRLARPLSRSNPAAVRTRDERATLIAQASQGRAELFMAATGQARQAFAARLPVKAPDQGEAKAALMANLDQFGKPGVLSARPAIDLTTADGSTPRYVVQVTVQPERLEALQSTLQNAVAGVPVRVRPASTLQRLRADRPADFVMLASARHELREPEFPDEVFFDDSGKQAEASVTASAFAARTGKPQIDYTQPEGATLDAVEEEVTLVLHASPDAGWDQLSQFLAGIEHELVVGMYDFTSGHILQALEQAMEGDDKRLVLTQDHPAPNPSRDQTNDVTFSSLSEAMSQRFAGAWALTRSDPKAPVWIYPNAYHIKVAVRDRSVFWLSSGNWNNSNQPEIDLSDLAAARKIAASHDRDWHAIVTHDGLAQTFRAFLENDYTVAHDAEVQAEGAAALQGRALDMPEVPLMAVGAARPPRSFFPPRTVRGKMTIQPLLTPDNYSGKVLPLIQQTREKFYMQTQYIHPSGKAGDEEHDKLIAAVKALVEQGIDVRLITSEFQSDDWVEKLVGAGIPTAVLRRQNKVHNKGVLVDGKIVMISSQNWSADGTQRNRDAGLIIYNEEANAYFEQIFLHDWNNLASPVA